MKTLTKVLLTAGLSLGIMSGFDAHAQEDAPVTHYGDVQVYKITDVEGGAVIGKTDDEGGAVIGKTDDEGVILYQGSQFEILDEVSVGDEIKVTYGGEHDEILAVEWAR